MNDEGYQHLLEQLRIEHRDLDDAIGALMAQPVVDQLQIARLKKKKLGLKDRIMRLEDQLVPDIIA
ncbi:MAG: YdcH family protein [Sphingorhabdus sp.]|uniref:YdcH family protein n=1 Tax=Sphingorhabdus sp. TaxID=1902408 RepID=UPI0038FD33A3